MKPGSVFNTVISAKNFYRNKWSSIVYEKEIGYTSPGEPIQGKVFVLFTINRLSRDIKNQVHVIVKE